MSDLALLGSAAATFVGLHLVLSSHPLRTPLVDRLGAGRFAGLYSALVGAAFVWMVWAWTEAPYVHLWTAPLWTRWIPFAIMPLALFFLVAGFTTPSPTVAGQDRRLEGGGRPRVRGVVRITRHPALWGFALWGASHVPVNGDARSLIGLSAIVVLALAGMAHIDRRRARAHPEGWRAFAERTSALPFAAIASGRQRWSGREIGLARPTAALALWVLLMFLHELVIGVPAWPS